jgi:tRNA A-37 threonylcarbamoyl transferase component Bud32
MRWPELSYNPRPLHRSFPGFHLLGEVYVPELRRRIGKARFGWWSNRPPLWILVLTVSFCGYFALLVYCDIARPVNPGYQATPTPQGVIITRVKPGTQADHAGLKAGDRLISSNGVTIVASDSWGSLGANYEIGVPMPLVVDRAGTRIHLQLLLPAETPRYWLSRSGLTLLVFRAAQLVTLLAGVLIAWRRPRDPGALAAAWFLVTCAAFVIALPYRIVMVWHGLPMPIRELFWLAHASSLVIGPILMTFVVSFPSRLPHVGLIKVVIWTLAAAAMAVPLYNTVALVYGGSELRTIGPKSLPLLTVMALSLVVAVVLSVLNYRRLTDLSERRRLRAVVAGIAIAALPGFWAVVHFWVFRDINQEDSIFQSPFMGLVAIALCAAPVSMMYACFRHRLFDVSVIIRKWLRYLLARSLVRAILPALGGWLLADLLMHRNETINTVLQRHSMMYSLVLVAAVAVIVWSPRWLDSIDRRFFRERHMANAVLREVAEQVRRAGSLDRVAPRVVAKIESVMHPEFAALLVRDPNEPEFRAIASAPAGGAPQGFDAHSKLAALARVMEQPIDVSEDGDMARKGLLPPADLEFVRRARIDTLIPVITPDDQLHSLLVLGPKRSEEPYAQEEYDVLVAIAENLSLLVARSAPNHHAPSLEECPQCGTCFDEGARVCSRDSATLTLRNMPRTLAGRYRLDRRLAAGGMGTVYEAFDTALERLVAAKVVRDNLTTTAGAAERFVEEARLAARLREHPNVVTVYDFGILNSRQPFLIMELLAGRTIRHELETAGKIAPVRILEILEDVCSAIFTAHQRGLIHRDLKPENIFLAETEHGSVAKVLDFGIAKPLSVVTDLGRRQTDKGVLVGTLEYMSPEQRRGEPPSRAWDLWSLAVITLEMLTGGPPPSALLPTILPWNPAEPLGRSHPRTAEVLNGALAIDARSRPADARALYLEIEEALRADGAVRGRSGARRHANVRMVWS